MNILPQSTYDDHKYRDYRISKRQGVIFRAIGNLALNHVQLWWLTLSAADKTLDWIDSQSVIRRKTAKLLRTWRYHVPSLEYVLIASGGDTGRNPHYHIIATAPLPDSWQETVIDSDCVPIGDTQLDRKKIARYCSLNMRQDAPFTSHRFRKSANWYAWANPEIYYLFRDLESSVYVYVHNSTISTNPPTETPPLKQCRLCGNHLPETPNYFNRNGKNFRTECYRCHSVMRRVSDMNRRARKMGVIGHVDYHDVLDLLLSCRDGFKYRDYWTKELTDTWELDHIVSLSIGGDNTIENLCITSPEINQRKADKPVNSWLQELYAMGYDHELMSELDSENWLRQLRFSA